MIDKMAKKSLILQQRKNDTDFISDFFSRKQRGFIHNVDTLYYSVEIRYNEELYCNLIRQLEKDKKNLNHEEHVISSIDTQLIMNGYSFGIYKYDLELPEEFLFLFAENTPNDSTPWIIVQIRSYALWIYGQNNAVDKSLYILKNMLLKYNITINDVKINRIDYCWHTNYYQDVERFLKINNINKKKVTRFRDWDTRGSFKSNDEIETDYLRLGRLNSNNCIFRCYLKSKEVIQQGYKPWFLKVWLLHGLINRFDYYCYEEAFKHHNWDYIHKARMQFFIDHAPDELNKQRKAEFRRLLDGKETSCTVIKEKINGLVPEVTLILNFEFQTMRKFFSSIELKPFASNLGNYELYILLDLRKSITNYLTHNTLRLIDKGKDTNCTRGEYTAFWERLRNTKFISAPVPEDSWKLIRQYTHGINAEMVRLQAGKLVATLSVYEERFQTDINQDIISLVSSLNDNDINRIQKHKKKKINQLGLQGSQTDLDLSSFCILNKDTGEMY